MKNIFDIQLTNEAHQSSSVPILLPLASHKLKNWITKCYTLDIVISSFLFWQKYWEQENSRVFSFPQFSCANWKLENRNQWVISIFQYSTSTEKKKSLENTEWFLVFNSNWTIENWMTKCYTDLQGMADLDKWFIKCI